MNLIMIIAFLNKRLQPILNMCLSDTQGFGLLGTASADGSFPAESGSRGKTPRLGSWPDSRP